MRLHNTLHAETDMRVQLYSNKAGTKEISKNLLSLQVYFVKYSHFS